MSDNVHAEVAAPAGIYSVAIDRAVVSLGLVILQTTAPDVEAIRADASRPHVVAALKDLFVGREGAHPGPVLGELVPGNRPVLIVAPEYALGAGDWNAVDEM